MFYLMVVISLIYMIIKNKKNIKVLQQNFYNENNRYLKWGNKNITKVFNIYDLFLLVINISNIFIRSQVLIFINLFYIILFIKEYNNIKQEQVKLPIKYTNRVKRLMVTEFLIFIIINLCYFVSQNIYLFIIINSFILLFHFYFLFIVNLINWPLEKLVYLYYFNKSKKKLKELNETEIVGITGSYGKTSSKNILNDILRVKYNSVTTPKNYNTKYGMMLTINNNINKFNDIFIAEMGAYKRGSIKSLCKMIKPKYGILTNIGTAHLDTFKSVENIQKAKFELIDFLPDDGVAILNADDSNQINYKIKSNCKKIWIGLNNKDADVLAQNIKMDSNGMNFDVFFKEHNKSYNFNTKLLGEANVYNILGALAFGLYKGMSISELQFGVKKLKPITHRLEIKKMSNMVIIDDAYNSNPVGSKMALDVLNLMDGIKIVVTPGMIELGEDEYKLNNKFGEYISDVADYVILVGKKQTEPIYSGLIKNKFNKSKIFIINDVKDAFSIIDKIETKKEKFVLLENDLPDIYNEKGKEGLK